MSSKVLKASKYRKMQKTKVLTNALSVNKPCVSSWLDQRDGEEDVGREAPQVCASLET